MDGADVKEDQAMNTYRVVCVIDIDADEDFKAETIEIQALHKSGAWMKLMEVNAEEFGFCPDLRLYHRVFRVLKRGQISQLKVAPTTNPEL